MGTLIYQLSEHFNLFYFYILLVLLLFWGFAYFFFKSWPHYELLAALKVTEICLPLSTS